MEGIGRETVSTLWGDTSAVAMDAKAIVGTQDMFILGISMFRWKPQFIFYFSFLRVYGDRNRC